MNRRALRFTGCLGAALVVIGSLRLLDLAHDQLNRALLQFYMGQPVQSISLTVKIAFLLNAIVAIIGAILLSYFAFHRAAAKKQEHPTIKSRSTPQALP